MSDFLLKHQILNCGDMKKDGKVPPNISSLNIFYNAVNDITGTTCPRDPELFSNLKQAINDELLDNVKKYSFTTLLPIPENDTLDISTSNVINKNNRKVVPANVTNAFIDASITPSNYFMSDKITICETPASYIDPGPREESSVFYPSESTIYQLNEYGFKTGSEFKYRKELDEDDYKYIEIKLDSNNYFKGSVNKKGEIKDTYTVRLVGIEYNKSAGMDFTDIFQKLFKGNREKNTYIFNNKDRKDAIFEKICTLLIFFKELGDTTQAIIISNLLKNGTSLNASNTCLLTTDTVLACRCALLNVPYLLYSDSIITYYSAIDEATYIKNMKLNEIKKVIENNNKIKEEYDEINTGIKDRTMYTINGIKYNITKRLKDRFQNIIDCIENVKKFLDILEKQLDDPSQKFPDDNNIITKKSSEIINQDFDKFRSIIQSLQAQTIYIYKGKSKEQKIISSKYSLFPLKLIIKEEYFSLKDYIDNIIFKDGIINYFSSENTNYSSATRGGANDDDVYNEHTLYCYSLLYPYIYCNPYLLPYILNKNDDELIPVLDNILDNILEEDYDADKNPLNDFTVPILLLTDDEINSLYSEKLLYYLNDDNAVPNTDKEIDNYQKYTVELLNKLDIYVRNTNNKSLFVASSISQEQTLQEAPSAAAAPPSQEAPSQEAPSAAAAASQPPSQEAPSQEAPSQELEMSEEDMLRQGVPHLYQYPSLDSEILTPKRKLSDELSYDEEPQAKFTKQGIPDFNPSMEYGGGKKTKNKNKKLKNKKTKKKYKSKSKILYKKKNIKKKITKKNKRSKKVKNTKKIKKLKN